MREIKFRLWNCINRHPSLSKMFYDIDNVMECLKQQVLHDAGKLIGYDHVNDGSAFMQFTGLRDKNGKEIYEGDVVKCGYGIGEVVFHAGCFMVEWIDDKGADMEFLFSRKGRRGRNSYEEFEVIGNIYENPELINQLK